MKLEKREITLNEKDSLKDVYYFETLLLSKYEREGKYFRKEVENELKRLAEETRLDREKVRKLYKEGSEGE